MEVLLKSRKLSADEIIQTLKEFAGNSNCWNFLAKESIRLTSLSGAPACMIMLEDHQSCPIVAVAKNEKRIYHISNIIPKESGYITPTEYKEFAKRFGRSVDEFLRKRRVPLRVSFLRERLDLVQIISSPIARQVFSQYLAMYPTSHHPLDIRRLDRFICAASRFCRRPINLHQLQACLRVNLRWSDEDARWCRERIEAGLEILSVYRRGLMSRYDLSAFRKNRRTVGHERESGGRRNT